MSTTLAELDIAFIYVDFTLDDSEHVEAFSTHVFDNKIDEAEAHSYAREKLLKAYSEDRVSIKSYLIER